MNADLGSSKFQIPRLLGGQIILQKKTMKEKMDRLEDDQTANSVTSDIEPILSLQRCLTGTALGAENLI